MNEFRTAPLAARETPVTAATTTINQKTNRLCIAAPQASERGRLWLIKQCKLPHAVPAV